MHEFVQMWRDAWHELPALIHAFDDPRMRHAVLVHLPIAGGVLGAAATVVLLFTGGRWRSLRWLTILLYALTAGIGWWAMNTGRDAVAQIDTNLLTDRADHELEIHEEMGEKVWMLLGATGGLVLVSGVRWRWVRFRDLVAATSAVATVGWISVTAHHGGELVLYGVNTPDFGTDPSVPPPTTAPAATVPTTQPQSVSSASPTTAAAKAPTSRPTGKSNFFGIPTEPQ